MAENIRYRFFTDDHLQNAALAWNSLNNFVSFECGEFVENRRKFFKSQPKLSRTMSWPNQRSIDFNLSRITEQDLNSTCSLNEIATDLKRSRPKTFEIRSKCEYYGRAKSPDISELELQAGSTVSLNRNNAFGGSFSTISASGYDEKYSNLAQEIEELKKQVAILMSAKDSSSDTNRVPKYSSTCPPPPPPPPPPPTPIVPSWPARSSKRENRRKSDESKKSMRLQMSDVLKNLQEGRANLKPVCQSSPVGTPRKNSQEFRRSSEDYPADSIAEALRKKFANVQFDSPLSDCENNSFNQKSFDGDFDESFGVRKFA